MCQLPWKCRAMCLGSFPCRWLEERCGERNGNLAVGQQHISVSPPVDDPGGIAVPSITTWGVQQNHSITAWLGLEGTLNIIQFQPHRHRQGCLGSGCLKSYKMLTIIYHNKAFNLPVILALQIKHPDELNFSKLLFHYLKDQGFNMLNLKAFGLK